MRVRSHWADVCVTRVQVDDLVLALDEDLRPQASSIAQRLRQQGRRVDLVLEGGRRMKWAFKVCSGRRV